MLHLRSKLYSKRSKFEAGLQAYERINSEPGPLKEEIVYTNFKQKLFEPDFYSFCQVNHSQKEQ